MCYGQLRRPSVVDRSRKPTSSLKHRNASCPCCAAPVQIREERSPGGSHSILQCTRVCFGDSRSGCRTRTFYPSPSPSPCSAAYISSAPALSVRTRTLTLLTQRRGANCTGRKIYLFSRTCENASGNGKRTAS